MRLNSFCAISLLTTALLRVRIRINQAVAGAKTDGSTNVQLLPSALLWPIPGW
jgi:hypothetical protein